MTTGAAQLFAAVDATWPPAQIIDAGVWTLRRGAGGGKRVSAATANAPFADVDLDRAETEMAALGQPVLFMIRPGDTVLDQALDARGYHIVDPVVMLTCPIEHLTDQAIPPVTTFVVWEPLAIMAELWAQGGVGPARLRVMDRAEEKTAILARLHDKPAGTGFVAIHDDIAMVHAVEVTPVRRRQGVAGWIMRQAAFWAAARGAETMAVLCVKTNDAALKLYSGLGFEEAAAYHYRLKPNAGDPHHG